MNKDDKVAFITIPVAVAIGAGLAFAGGDTGHTLGDIPIMYLCVAAAFVIQWIAFVPAYIFKTEKFYDLTGSATYLSVAAFALFAIPDADIRSYIIAAFIFIWAARLGFFLFRRILHAGEDSRFAAVRGNFWRFLMAWTLQGLWVTFSLAAGVTAITAARKEDVDAFAIIGALIWVFGFSIEAIADWQKGRFRHDAANKGRFIQTGLWSWSRHPNYFGEIVLWTGIAVMAFPVLQGFQYATLVSPFFVTLLLTKISGVPLLEAAADKKWGGQADYEEYKRATSVLLLIPPKKKL